MKYLFWSAILALSFTVSAQQQDAALSFNNTSCVRSDKFQSCWANATAKAQSCVQANCSSSNTTCTDSFHCITTDIKCERSCTCVAYTEWLNCAASHCWNHVYGCAYQALAIQAIDKCQLADRYPPYFPPPAGFTGHGACNCHFGEAYKAVRGYADDRKTCNNNINSIASGLATGQNATYHSECDCCAADGQLNALTQYCPARAKRLTFWSSLVPFVGLSARYSSSCANVLPTVFSSASAVCAATPIGITLNATTVASQAQTTFSPITYTVVTSVAVTYKEKRQATTTATDVLGDDDGSLSAPPSGSSFAWSLVDGIPATAVADDSTSTTSASAAASTSKSFALARNGNVVMGSGLLGGSIGLIVCTVVGFVTGTLALVL